MMITASVPGGVDRDHENRFENSKKGDLSILENGDRAGGIKHILVLTASRVATVAGVS